MILITSLQVSRHSQIVGKNLPSDKALIGIVNEIWGITIAAKNAHSDFVYECGGLVW